jgi:hypothetical protein
MKNAFIRYICALGLVALPGTALAAAGHPRTASHRAHRQAKKDSKQKPKPHQSHKNRAPKGHGQN